jgi:hypothetical protein
LRESFHELTLMIPGIDSYDSLVVKLDSRVGCVCLKMSDIVCMYIIHVYLWGMLYKIQLNGADFDVSTRYICDNIVRIVNGN